MADGNFIYTTQNLSRVHPPDKVVIKDLSLCFFFGAKIGVIGGNGAGKSSLLRIMAGLDKEFIGQAGPADGIKIGYLSQEPQLDPTKNVFENVLEGAKETKALLTRFEEINNRFGEGPDADEMEKLLAEQAKVQDAIDAANAWELDRTIERAMDALRCPPGRLRT
jgi:sulfate-transporting ATPase